MNIAKYAKPVKKVLLLLLVAVPFAFIGWYMLIGLVMAFIIKNTIPDEMNNGDRKVAAVLWCLLVSAVLVLCFGNAFLYGWLATSIGMSVIAWPRDIRRKRHRRRKRRGCWNNQDYDVIVITNAEVIDI